MPGEATNDPESGRARVRLPHLPALAGLRGVAVGVILLFHADFAWLGGGFLGVSTFFTLSGFLITSLLLGEHERTGRIDLGAFYARRLRRILPAALLGLAGIALFGAGAAEISQQMRLLGDGLAALFYAANWWLMATGAEYASQLGAPSPVQHYWSLAIEEQFYLVHPWLALAALSAFGRRGLIGVLSLLILGSWGWSAWLESEMVSSSRLYYGTDTRCAELFAGALLALFWDPRTKSQQTGGSGRVDALGVLGLVASAVFWVTASPHAGSLYRGGLALYTLASVAIVAAAVLPVGIVRRSLAVGPLRWLGRVSYGAYLYHWPVYLWLDADRTGLGPWALTALRVSLTLGLAELSYRFVEEPIRSGRRILSWRRTVAPLAAAAAVVVSLLAATRGVPQTWPELAVWRPATSVPDEAMRVAVIGDSVALNVGEGLVRWGRESGRVRVQQLAHRGCGVARGARIGDDAKARTRACDHWPSRWGRPLQRLRPDVVVVHTAAWDLRPRKLPTWPEPREIGDEQYDAWLRSEFRAAIDLWTRHGARVVWLTAICSRPGMRGPVAGFDPERVALLNERVVEPLAREERHRVTLVDLNGAVCPGGRFTNSLDGIEDLRPDGIHFSPAAADWLAGWLGPQVAAAARTAR